MKATSAVKIQSIGCYLFPENKSFLLFTNAGYLRECERILFYFIFRGELGDLS